MNIGKSKVMVCSSGRMITVSSGNWSCGICGKGELANCVKYTPCKRWISNVVVV